MLLPQLFLFLLLLLFALALLAHCSQCGISYQRQAYVIGGSEVYPLHAWPWTVSLRDRSLSTRQHFCGGALIGDRIVLTAAHCMFDIVRSKRKKKKLKDLFVSVGTHTLSKRVPGEEWIPIRKYHIHPDFDPSSVDAFHHDLAVVELKTPVRRNSNASRPVCLPERDKTPKVGEKCVVTGWGYDADLNASDEMQQAVVPIVAPAVCRQSRYWSTLVNEETMLCAGVVSKEHPAGSCQGDSGGPLFCTSDGHTWVLNGVVSWGATICLSKPGVFADVARMRDWIDDVFRRSGALLSPSVAESTHGGPPPVVTREECNNFDNWLLINRLMVRGPSPVDPISRNVSLIECVASCCARRHVCEAVQYFAHVRKCLLLKEGACTVSSANLIFPADARTLYVGRRCS